MDLRKQLTIRMEPDLHQRIRVRAALDAVTMNDAVLALLKNAYPDTRPRLARTKARGKQAEPVQPAPSRPKPETAKHKGLRTALDEASENAGAG